MDVSSTIIELIIQEHLHRPLNGEVLLVGRQNNDITPQAMTNLLQLYGLFPRVPLQTEAGGARITDAAVFHSLAACNVTTLDVTDAEGAEFVHNLNYPLSDKLKGKFDFVFDASCMDNIFAGPQALINLSDLVRPGGRLVIYDASNSAPTAYLQYSPDWFFDFFAINNYADCKIYILEFPEDAEPVVPASVPDGGLPMQTGCLWHFDPAVVYTGQNGLQNSQIVDGVQRYFYVVAEKAATSSATSLNPVQLHYRGDDQNVYIEASQRFRASPRPLFQPRTGEPFTAPSLSGFDVVYPIVRWNRRAYPVQPLSSYHNESPVEVPGPAGVSYRESAASIRYALNEARSKWKRLESEKEARIRERDQAFAERDEAQSMLRYVKGEEQARLRERDQALTDRDEARKEWKRFESESWKAPFRSIKAGWLAFAAKPRGRR